MLVPKQLSFFAICLTYVLPVVSHMLLAQPHPLGQINNSPLDGPNAAGGGSFPCKYNGDASFYSNAVTTTIPLGSNYTVKFTGSAVHGGGSCQFSVSKDLAPTAASTFKVIYSIQGGCPARNTPGNLGNDATMADPYQYPFTMPSDLEPGQYTFAWTWINKVGNREFYMNCAAIVITATDEYKGDPEYYDTLPDLTVVNISGVDCVSEGDNGKGSFKYQNPGQFVETNDALQYVEKQCFAPISKVVASNAGSSSSANTGPSSDSSKVPQDDSQATTSPTASAGKFYSQTTTSASASTGFTTVLVPSSFSSSAATSTAIQTVTSPSTSPTDNITCPPTWQSCTTVGFFCVDKLHFGLCAFGCMPQVQAMAEGVGCDMQTNTLYDLRIGN